MSRVGRVTFVWIALLMGLVALGVLWMLEALDTQLKPVCLEAVAPAPAGARFVETISVAPGEDACHLRYDDGTEVRIPRDPRPQRIVSSLPGITEMIAYLGGEDRLVAVTEHCDHPASVTALPKVSVLPFDAEGILQVKPDLVVVDRRLHARDLDRIRLRCPAVLLLETSRSLEHLAVSLRVLAVAIGTDEASEASGRFVTRLRALRDDLVKRAPSKPPRVLVVAQWEPLYVLGRGSLIDDLVRLCGCINVACDLKGDASGTFPEELVLARRPDWILSTNGKPMPDRLRRRWRHVPAVRHGRFFDASSDDIVRAGPRILDGLERLADALLATEGGR